MILFVKHLEKIYLPRSRSGDVVQTGSRYRSTMYYRHGSGSGARVWSWSRDGVRYGAGYLSCVSYCSRNYLKKVFCYKEIKLDPPHKFWGIQI